MNYQFISSSKPRKARTSLIRSSSATMGMPMLYQRSTYYTCCPNTYNQQNSMVLTQMRMVKRKKMMKTIRKKVTMIKTVRKISMTRSR